MAAPVLIDTDPGIDDALALLLAWGSPEISVEAITTVAGNVSVEQGMVNVFRLLALRKPTPRPVVALGAAEPLARPLVTAQRYHGEDGLGDLTDWPETEKPPLEHDAVSVIIDQARRSQRLLTLVALGPLTHLRSEEHTSELQSQSNLLCRPLLEKNNIQTRPRHALSRPP